MRRMSSTLFTAALLALCLNTGIAAQAGAAEGGAVSISCGDFRQKPDGSWTPLRRTVVSGPHGPFTVEPGQIFRIQLQGTTHYGVKVAEILDDRCR